MFGLAYLVIGVLMLRPGRLGLWLGAIVVGVGAALSALVALANPGALAVSHAAIDWVVPPICIVLLAKRRGPSDAAS